MSSNPKELPTITEEARVLYRAADIIDERGWTAGTNRARSGGGCIMQAVADASPSARRAMELCIGLAFHMGVEPAVWNDTICKSGPEASAMLRRVAGSLG